ncbi:MAG: hypothetical protein IZT58_17525, partial [Actinobacteria bacterium]|nr:hypothetical protein [Actinomycetota bacterium]
DMPDEAAALAAEYCADRGPETNPILGPTTCTDGKINIEVQWPGPSVIQTRIAEILDEGWKSSFNVSFNELAQDENIQQIVLGEYNVATWRQFDAVDPSTDKVWLMCRTIDFISLNFPRYCDEERDLLIDEAQGSTDPDVRVPLYQEISQNMHDAYTYVFLTHNIWDNAFAEDVRDMCDRTTLTARCCAAPSTAEHGSTRSGSPACRHQRKRTGAGAAHRVWPRRDQPEARR